MLAHSCVPTPYLQYANWLGCLNGDPIRTRRPIQMYMQSVPYCLARSERIGNHKKTVWYKNSWTHSNTNWCLWRFSDGQTQTMGKIVVGNKKSNRPATFITKAKRRRMNNKKTERQHHRTTDRSSSSSRNNSSSSSRSRRQRQTQNRTTITIGKKLCRVECTRQNGILMIVTTTCETGLGNGTRIRTRTSTDIDSSGGNKG